MNLKAIDRRFNAARDRRKASVIDTQSDAGSWAEALQYVQFPVSEYYDLDARLALRKAARLEKNPHKRGHITRAINAGAV